MSFTKFIFSRVFLKQLALAVIVIVALCFAMLKWLKYSTNHGDFIEVPDLKGKSIEVVQMELNDKSLVMEIQDSANFNPDYPRFSVIEQYPPSGAQVKEDRKIYLTLNPSGFRKVEIPAIVHRTYRQAKPALEALGFEVGRISYVDDLGKDEVLAVKFKGETLKAGDLLPMTSTIDLVLGNGNRAEN